MCVCICLYVGLADFKNINGSYYPPKKEIMAIEVPSLMKNTNLYIDLRILNPKQDKAESK